MGVASNAIQRTDRSVYVTLLTGLRRKSSQRLSLRLLRMQRKRWTSVFPSEASCINFGHSAQGDARAVELPPRSNSMGRMESAQLRAKRGSKPRERLLDAAYDLFGAHGVSQVGIDSILAKSGFAKASLYDNFQSKEDLAIAFLERREELWTRAWLETEIKRRASDPEGRLLAIFDASDTWFQTTDFEGCPFIKVLLESRVSSRLHGAAATHLSRVRAIIHGLAQQANLSD